MKQFLLKSFISLALLALIIGAIKSSVPYYWGNPIIQPKVEYLDKHYAKFDTYFVGSSKIYRHIVPAVYDSITGKNSFNFGAGATFYTEMNYLFENFLEDHPLAPETEIVFESIVPNELSEVNFNTVKTKYCMDTKRALIGVKYFAGQKNWDEVYMHISTYFQNLFGIGMLMPILDYHLAKSPRLLKLSKKQKGFLAYDQELKVSKDKQKLKNIRRGREKYLKQKKDGTLPKINRNPLKIKTLDADEVGLSKFPQYDFYLFQGGLAVNKEENIWNYGHYSLKGALDHTEELAHAKLALSSD